MKIETFINHGTIIEIETVQTMNLTVDKGQVRIGDRDPKDYAQALEAEAEEKSLCSEKENEACPFSEAQQKASGIKIQAGVVLTLMHDMRPRFTQKIDWLSFYSVLLRRRWVDANLASWSRMVHTLFGVSLDPRALSADLRKLGSPDYTLWTDADSRIVRRKLLASDFDTRLTAYFEQKRAAVMSAVRG